MLHPRTFLLLSLLPVLAFFIAPWMLNWSNKVSTTFRHNLNSSLPQKLNTSAKPQAVKAVKKSSIMQSMKYNQPVVLDPSTGAPTASVIFLHGLGDSGNGWADIGVSLQAAVPHARFIFPHAPKRSITINNGGAMPAWYDIHARISDNRTEDKEGTDESRRYVEELIAGEVAAGVPSSRIVVGGFSQGGAVSLYMLRSATKLAGVLALSTYLPFSKEEVLVSDGNKSTPTLMCHGDADTMIPYSFGQKSHQLLDSLMDNVEFATFKGMAHSACPAELELIKVFLKRVLPAA